MKTWIKRTLIGLAASATLLGGLGAWAHNKYGGGWQGMSESDRAEMKQRMVDRVAGQLELDATQKARLGVLATQLEAQHAALRAGTPDPRAAIQGLVAGNAFDRAGANALIQQKLAAVTNQSPALVNALGDFYDGLNPDQQAKVRQFVAKGGHHMGRGHPGEGRHGGERN
jgi:periplasmic protein CpxP/Spy